MVWVLIVFFIAGCTEQRQPKLEDPEAYSNRGLAYFYIKEYDKAWNDIKKAQALGVQILPEFLKMLREASGI